MHSYELLVIFPGTLAETEVASLADTVKTQLTDLGGKTVELIDLGKSRLAYPMKHIRYGYFRMYHFTAEPQVVPSIQAKVLLVNDVLRAFIKIYDPKQKQSVAHIMSDVAIAAEAEEEKRVAPVMTDRAANEVVEMHTVSKPKEVAVPEPTLPQTTEAVELVDIDKKLDELLESDLTKV